MTHLTAITITITIALWQLALHIESNRNQTEIYNDKVFVGFLCDRTDKLVKKITTCYLYTCFLSNNLQLANKLVIPAATSTA